MHPHVRQDSEESAANKKKFQMKLYEARDTAESRKNNNSRMHEIRNRSGSKFRQ